MGSDEEFLSFSASETYSSPVPERKLKRLKRAIQNVSQDPLPSPPIFDVAPPVHTQNSPALKDLATREKTLEGFEERDNGSVPHMEGFDKVNDQDSCFDGLGVEKGGPGAKRALEFDGEGEEDWSAEMEIEKEPEKDQYSLDVSQENKEKVGKKKKRFKSGSDRELAYSTGSSKRGEGKERRERIKELRAESQRLLRETRDASFKPAPFVQKPVSSILEKIRKRKHEVSQKLFNANISSFIYGNDAFSRDVTPDLEFENASVEGLEQHKVTKPDIVETTAFPFGEENKLDPPSTEEADDVVKDRNESLSFSVDLNEESRQIFRAPVNDTQDLGFDSRKCESKEEMPSSPLEEILAPSLLAMNLNFDSAPPDDFSSDGGINDKENIDPRFNELTSLSSSPKGDPVKAFVDDEAEEEDDSDEDLRRFQDNEEDEENIDIEELNDIIASGYEEKPIDNEMRNLLHQKWLEQQDAAGTENLLQRLKCGSKQVEKTLLEDEEDSEVEEDEEVYLDDKAAECLDRRNLVRMNLKKAKEMIPQMFTDKDDIYMSSDDEETENQPVKRRATDRDEGQAAFLSPAEVEGSKEIFGLIKRLNGVPGSRKKAKITSYFHTSIDRNTTVPSKSSFLGRGSENSLPSLRKHGSSAVRSFIFERDDSNSKSAISMSEDTSDLTQRENKPRKTASARFSSSQNRSKASNSQTAAEMNSGPSLHEILRRPSLQSSHYQLNSMVGQVEAIYASFRLDQKQAKKELNASIRAV